MESFEPKQRGVKEKNFYILHLDTPRIIILASVSYWNNNSSISSRDGGS
jgi:hypothetical protein